MMLCWLSKYQIISGVLSSLCWVLKSEHINYGSFSISSPVEMGKSIRQTVSDCMDLFWHIIRIWKVFLFKFSWKRTMIYIQAKSGLIRNSNLQCLVSAVSKKSETYAPASSRQCFDWRSASSLIFEGGHSLWILELKRLFGCDFFYKN